MATLKEISRRSLKIFLFCIGFGCLASVSMADDRKSGFSYDKSYTLDEYGLATHVSLMIKKDGVLLCEQQVELPHPKDSAFVADKMIESDLNFDGVPDLMIRLGYFGAGGGNLLYEAFLWNEDTQVLKRVDGFSDLSSPSIDAKNRRIECSGRPVANYIEKEFYTWEDGELVLSLSVRENVLDGNYLVYNDIKSGYYIRLEDGSIEMSFKTERLPQWANLSNDEVYSVSGLVAPCMGFMVGDIGQDTNPVLCMLTENGTVQVLQLYESFRSVSFEASPELKGMNDIHHFETGGGGEYEDEGKTLYSYVTIYAIDGNGEKHEVELPEPIAWVMHAEGRQEAIDFIAGSEFPKPLIYGEWKEYESTFVVIPASSSSCLELWKSKLGDDYVSIKDGDAPIIQTAPGQPLIFSYEVPEIIPLMMVLCIEEDGKTSQWIPMFSGMDGSLITDTEYVKITPALVE